jgi:hypothetical protein
MRELFRSAFVQAVENAKASKPAAARWMGVDTTTVKNWFAGKVAIKAEVVAASPKLGEHFLACATVAIRKLARAERRGRR